MLRASKAHWLSSTESRAQNWKPYLDAIKLLQDSMMQIVIKNSELVARDTDSITGWDSHRHIFTIYSHFVLNKLENFAQKVFSCQKLSWLPILQLGRVLYDTGRGGSWSRSVRRSPSIKIWVELVPPSHPNLKNPSKRRHERSHGSRCHSPIWIYR